MASWVDAAPFRAHVRHLMAAGSLDIVEVAVVLGLSTSAVVSLLDGRAGRPTRRLNRQTARRLLLVSAAEVRGLRWCAAPTGGAVCARDRLLAFGWSIADLAAAVGFETRDVAGLGVGPRCSRLLAVRLVGLARSLPGPGEEQDAVPQASAA